VDLYTNAFCVLQETVDAVCEECWFPLDKNLTKNWIFLRGNTKREYF